MAGLVHNVWGELEQRLNKTITQRFPEMTFFNGVDIPTTFDLEPGAQSVSVDVVTGYGTAGLLGQESSDIPLVQVNLTKDQFPVVMAVAGYAMGFKSERSYNFSGKADLITDRSVLLVRRAIDERLNWFAAYGDPAIGARGFYNNAQVTVDNNAFNPNTATYSDWITFVLDQVLGIGTASFGTVVPTDILMSRNAIKRAAMVTDPQNANVSALMAIRDRLAAIDGYQNITIRSRPESDASMLTARAVPGITPTKDRIVVYRKDPMAQSRQMEASLAELMPEKYVFADPKANVIYPMFSCASATAVHELNAMKYVDIVAAT